MTPKQIIFSPGRTLIFSALFVIFLGALLLLLPQAQKIPISPIDCLFTSVSTACVTGVLSVPFESFTLFGKIIILLLMQIGGIGIITLTLSFISLFMDLGMATQLMIGQVLELDTWKKAQRFLFFIILFTVCIEALGSIIIFFSINAQYTTGQALFHAIFHSVSSFCNVGLSSFGSNMYHFGESMLPYQHNLIMLCTTGLLILLGGVGFLTWYELFFYVKARLKGKRYNLSLTTKVVIIMTIALISTATLMLIALEGKRQFPHTSGLVMFFNMLFNAISYRSTGLTTIDLNTMHLATVFMIIMYSFIGSSPGSTGSGIKVTTFALFLATTRAVITGRTVVDLKGRRIPQDQVFKAMAVLALSIGWIIISTFLLLLTERHTSFINLFFESVSSFTTLGLATSITPTLSVPGKILIMMSMFIGRIGSLTLLLALRARHYERVEFQYPVERIMMS